MIRSILVVLAGWVAVGILVVCTDLVLGRMYPNEYVQGKIPPDWLSCVSLVTSTLWSVVGGWVTARFAASKPWHHWLGLVVWGEAMGIVSAVMFWDKMQHWYQIALILLWAPAVGIGCWIHAGKPTLGKAA